MSGKLELTPQQLVQWEAVHAHHPAWKARWDLLAEYARARGGIVLEYWKRRLGPAFGESSMWSFEACAEHLHVAMADLWRLEQETWKWVEPRLEADPHCRPQQDEGRFTYRRFSNRAQLAVFQAAKLAVAGGSSRVDPSHLRRAVGGETGPEFDPWDRRLHLPFGDATSAVLERAFQAAVRAGEKVQLGHLRAALDDPAA